MENTVLPLPTIERLSALYGLLGHLPKDERTTISSQELGRLTGESAHTVRKDLAYLKPRTVSSQGYDIEALMEAIAEVPGLATRRRACIVGLGRLGQALLQYTDFAREGIDLCAGFDSDVNKLELLHSTIPLFPSHRITAEVREQRIGLAIIAVPPRAAQPVADRLCAGGISGILNFSSPVKVTPQVEIRQLSVVEELRILSILIDRRSDYVQDSDPEQDFHVGTRPLLP